MMETPQEVAPHRQALLLRSQTVDLNQGDRKELARPNRPLGRIKKERPLMHERPQGSHFHAPDLMNNPTKTAKGDEMTSQASSSSLPIIQPSIQLMPQLSKRFFRCFA